MFRDQVDMNLLARQKRQAARLRFGKPPEILGVDSIKRTIFQYLNAEGGRTGYCHFPVGRDNEYYEQLTGERLVPVRVRGKRPELRWTAIYPSVEALDCRVYAYAGLLFYGVDRLSESIGKIQRKRFSVRVGGR